METRRPLVTAVVVSLCLMAYGCGLNSELPNRKLSQDGQFWAELQIVRASVVAGGDRYFVEVGKVHPNWKDTVTFNRKVEAYSLNEGGEISIDWVNPRHLLVSCWGCQTGALNLGLDQWQGVSIQYAYKEAKVLRNGVSGNSVPFSDKPTSEALALLSTSAGIALRAAFPGRLLHRDKFSRQEAKLR